MILFNVNLHRCLTTIVDNIFACALKLFPLSISLLVHTLGLWLSQIWHEERPFSSFLSVWYQLAYFTVYDCKLTDFLVKNMVPVLMNLCGLYRKGLVTRDFLEIFTLMILIQLSSLNPCIKIITSVTWYVSMIINCVSVIICIMDLLSVLNTQSFKKMSFLF